MLYKWYASGLYCVPAPCKNCQQCWPGTVSVTGVVKGTGQDVPNADACNGMNPYMYT